MTRPQQRRYEILASNLLIFGSLAGIVINYFLKQGYWTTHFPSYISLFTLLVGFLFAFWQAYYIRKGRRWAKLVYVVLTSIGLLLMAIDYKRTLVGKLTSPVLVINAIAQLVLTIGITTLLLLSLRKPTPQPAAVENY